MKKNTLLVLPGDGIGKEVTKSSLDLISSISISENFQLEVIEEDLHGASWEKHKSFCRDEIIDLAKKSDAVLVGAVGGPKWDNIVVEGGPKMQDGLMRLRKDLDTFAGLRPIKYFKSLSHLSPFKKNVVLNTDIFIIREMCGGIYFAEPRGIKKIKDIDYGFDTSAYSKNEIERIGKFAFQLASKRNGYLVSVDKSNVMHSGKLWRKTIDEISKFFPNVKVKHLLADNAVLEFVINPRQFDVILSDNLFSDILSDLAGAINGSLGILPSASFNTYPEKNKSVFGIYEPVHGSAPEIAGSGLANPIGSILSTALMFQYSFNRKDISNKIENAVKKTLDYGHKTLDLGGKNSTKEITDKVISNYLDE